MKRELIGLWPLDTPAELIDAQMRASAGQRISAADLRALGIAVIAWKTGWSERDGLLVDEDGKRHFVVTRTLKPEQKAASFPLGDRDWDRLVALFVERDDYSPIGWMTIPKTRADEALHPLQTSVRLTWSGER